MPSSKSSTSSRPCYDLGYRPHGPLSTAILRPATLPAAAARPSHKPSLVKVDEPAIRLSEGSSHIEAPSYRQASAPASPSLVSLRQSPKSPGVQLLSEPVPFFNEAVVLSSMDTTALALGRRSQGRKAEYGVTKDSARHLLPLASALEGHAGHQDSNTVWDSEIFWLSIYFVFNLGLTLFNKVVLVSFPFPYTLTGLHTLSGCIGSFYALNRGHFSAAHLSTADNVKLALFSILYTINIAISNVSLQLVTVPFHQVVRAATPLFTILISSALLGQRTSTRKLLSLLPVIAGVGFATYGDYSYTLAGLVLTVLGTFLAALKTVMTNLIQTGSGGQNKLHPLDLLMRMSPLAFIQCVALSWSSGELERVREYGAIQMSQAKLVALLINGILAFGLNVVSMTANKKTSALTMTVAANVKQVLTIVFAVVIFDLTITPINGLGIFLTLLGGARYAWLGHAEKRLRSAGG